MVDDLMAEDNWEDKMRDLREKAQSQHYSHNDTHLQNFYNDLMEANKGYL